MTASFVKLIDNMSARTGKWVAWLVIPNVLALVYEVIARYILNNPTIWSYEVTYFLYGSHFLLGAAYVLSVDAHIRIDIFTSHFSLRTRAVIDTVGYLVLFFPVIIALIYAGGQYVLQSIEMGEQSGLSPWRPYLYPYKALITISFILLFLQGISCFVRNITLLARGAKP
jgi:TRAP-type mannitol/chloroaromatic compound transport system permease small subunit